MSFDWTRLTLAHDKANHAIYGFLVALAVTAAARWAGFEPWAGAIGAAGALVVGGMKELMDHMDNQVADEMGVTRPHTVSAGDVVATAAGGALHWVVLALAAPWA